MSMVWVNFDYGVYFFRILKNSFFIQVMKAIALAYLYSHFSIYDIAYGKSSMLVIVWLTEK